METSRKFCKPVIIVGAPRSGTSLLQKIIRENPAFVSVARESDVIWNPYIHPRVNNWRQEGLVDRQLSQEDIAFILEEYGNKALPAKVWSRWSQSRIMESAFLSRLVRRVYPCADRVFTTVRRILPDRRQDLRLVDKSVHFALWLDAVNQVFPGALYIHIARNGRDCVRSMMNGWLDPERFNTYLLPKNLRTGGARYWCFPMPARWREYLELPLAERVAHQWVDIQGSINKGLDAARQENRYLLVRLEDLTGEPAQNIRRISDYIELDWSGYFEHVAANMPVINASQKNYLTGEEYGEQPDSAIMDIIRNTQVELGYQV